MRDKEKIIREMVTNGSFFKDTRYGFYYGFRNGLFEVFTDDKKLLEDGTTIRGFDPNCLQIDCLKKYDEISAANRAYSSTRGLSYEEVQDLLEECNDGN